jgi:hypothetical protein
VRCDGNCSNRMLCLVVQLLSLLLLLLLLLLQAVL